MMELITVKEQAKYVRAKYVRARNREENKKYDNLVIFLNLLIKNITNKKLKQHNKILKIIIQFI